MNERSRILQELFPRPPRHASLRYDHESQRYQVEFDEEAAMVAERDDVCAVCLDPIEDNCVASGYACEHTYHYDCLLDWIQHDHDDCPQCRRQLWSPWEYDNIARQLQGQQPGGEERSTRSYTNPRTEGSQQRTAVQNEVGKPLLVLIAVIFIFVLAPKFAADWVQADWQAVPVLEEETEDAIKCSSTLQVGYTLPSYYSSDTFFLNDDDLDDNGRPYDYVCEDLCGKDPQCNAWMSRDDGCYLSRHKELTSIIVANATDYPFDIRAFTFNSRCCAAPDMYTCLNPSVLEDDDYWD